MAVTIRTAFEQGYLWLAFLEIGGVKVAASLNFDYKNKLWGYNSGVSREHMELSPGWVLLAHTIQWCCENGRYEFDFMRGDEEYKYRFGGGKSIRDEGESRKTLIEVLSTFLSSPRHTSHDPILDLCFGHGRVS